LANDGVFCVGLFSTVYRLLLEPEEAYADAVPANAFRSIIMTSLPHSDQRQPLRQSLTGARLRKHADYQRAYAGGRKRQSSSMSWFLAPQPTSGYAAEHLAGPRVGLTAGKVMGKAHERNRIKRRMREALRRHVEVLPAGCDLILHPRRTVLTMEFSKLEAEIVRILQQAKAEAARIAPPVLPPRPVPPQVASS
jgi:ribonuclease P protein component